MALVGSGTVSGDRPSVRLGQGARTVTNVSNVQHNHPTANVSHHILPQFGFFGLKEICAPHPGGKRLDHFLTEGGNGRTLTSLYHTTSPGS